MPLVCSAFRAAQLLDIWLLNVCGARLLKAGHGATLLTAAFTSSPLPQAMNIPAAHIAMKRKRQFFRHPLLFLTIGAAWFPLIRKRPFYE